jgi:hypothetical protein
VLTLREPLEEPAETDTERTAIEQG